MKRQVDKKHLQDRPETLLSTIKSNLLSFLKLCLICFLFAYVVINYGIRPIRVSGPSMFPNIKNGEIAITNAFQAKFTNIERGDIVVCQSAKTKRMIVKRVIALPGEKVFARNDTVFVNGKPLEEPYLDNEWSIVIKDTGELFTEDFDEVVLGENEYWVMGDNRINSLDSRNYGPFKKSEIHGKNIFVIFPFNKFGFVG